MALICGEYRSDYFFKLRHHWEPWVNRQVNDAFSDELANKRQIEIRNVFTTSSLTEAGIDLNELKGCIDFGGDLGQFIPDAIKPPLVVYEPTGTRRGLRPNVIGCEKLSELVDKVDLGLNCYVLKHIDEPWHAVSERDLPCRIVGPLENADVITTNTFWIGVYPGLDKHQIDFTTESIHKFMKSN